MLWRSNISKSVFYNPTPDERRVVVFDKITDDNTETTLEFDTSTGRFEQRCKFPCADTTWQRAAVRFLYYTPGQKMAENPRPDKEKNPTTNRLVSPTARIVRTRFSRKTFNDTMKREQLQHSTIVYGAESRVETNEKHVRESAYILTYIVPYNSCSFKNRIHSSINKCLTKKK